MNYTKTLSIFLIALLVFGFIYYYFIVSLWWILLPLLYLVISLVYGSVIIQSGFFANVLCSGNTDNREIAITFDDGPNKEFSNEILSTLDEFGVKATFFVIGKNIKGNEEIIRKMDSKGHTIGNHTFSHSFFIDFKNTKSFIEEISNTSKLIYDITARQIRLFRPPYGVTTPAIAKACKHLKFDIIGWNIRSFDTTPDSHETISARVIRQIKPGAILLFHDTSIKTNIVLRNILEYVNQHGIRIVSVKEILDIREYK